MKFETLKIGKSSNQKKVFVGVTSVSLVLLMSLSLFSYAKYKVTNSVKIAEGTINFKPADFNMVAMYREKSGTTGNYEQITSVPASGYTLNSTNTKCEVGGVKDSSIGITYASGKLNFTGVSKTGTKCYAYFDYIRDTSKPTITSVTKTSDEKTSIAISVVATDDQGVTEYWYKIGTSAAVKGTGTTHTFTGLTAGTTYAIEVYVKDAAGNQSTTWTESFATKANAQTVDNIIASLNAKTTTPDFSKTATTNEGVYKVSDGMYGNYSYYWRGAVTNNYVKFANLCWRIVRINGDKTVRLIYDGTTCHANGANADSIAKTSQAYNASYDRSEYVGYTYSTGSQRGTGTASNLKTQTESWYKTNITDKGFDGKVATGKFCNDRNTASGYTWASQPSSTFYYAAYGRLSSAKTPTLSCTNTSDIYNLKAGAITADEVAFAGGVYGQANSSYYLYNNQYYWTMSPCHWCYNSTSNRWTSVFYVYSDGQLWNYYVNNTTPGVRPVINLVSGTQFKEGTDGTQSNPYEVL